MISVLFNGAFSIKGAIQQGVGGVAEMLGFGDFLQANRALKLMADSTQINCRIVELQENQSWNLPALPTDDGEFRNDTIFRQPKTLSVKVFVKGELIDDFLNSLKSAQNTLQTFSIYSLDNQIYESLKLAGYSRETNSNMLGAAHFMLDFQEIIFVKALAKPYTNNKNAGYSKKINSGSKNAQKPKAGSIGTEWLDGVKKESVPFRKG